jgi:hypothetical protein
VTWIVISRSRRGQCFATVPECSQGNVILPTDEIVSDAELDGVEEVLITDRFGEELKGAALRRLHSQARWFSKLARMADKKFV